MPRLTTAPILPALLAPLAFSAPLLAQEECINAVALSLGPNGPFTNFGATTSLPAWTCPPSGGADVWYSFLATSSGNLTASLCGANYDTAIEVFDGSAGCAALVFIGCNDDFCMVDSQITFPVTIGSTYYIRVGGFGGATGNFPLELTLDYGLQVVGVAEQVPSTGILTTGGGFFRGNDFLRWNYADPFGNFPGAAAAVVLNLGVGGSAPFGVTLQIPGFNQLWGGSTPSGAAEVFAPLFVGGNDYTVFVPTGLFAVGDTVRIQALALSTLATGALPVIPSINSIEWEYTSCAASEGFEGLFGVGNYPVGWSDGGGTVEWQGYSGATPSAGTGPSAAAGGTSYFYCEVSAPVLAGDTFIVNSDLYPSNILSSNTLTFDLNRLGANVGVLEVRMGDGSGTFPTTLATYSGPEPTGVEWNSEVLPLPTPLPTNIQFQFSYVRGGGFTGDIAIDNVCLQ